jgi:hypothetical protein
LNIDFLAFEQIILLAKLKIIFNNGSEVFSQKPQFIPVALREKHPKAPRIHATVINVDLVFRPSPVNLVRIHKGVWHRFSETGTRVEKTRSRTQGFQADIRGILANHDRRNRWRLLPLLQATVICWQRALASSNPSKRI